ncbi:odorant receptor 131-2-like [Pleuronectes platessa]|uniref:odorant receptor 131-2-like n=1 Tax=Pleuronectes platessa TaxID=8262 RepID=UPI00232A5591|nr:odorant receptor 131-2-like [Pleuronectes platessa]
MSGTAQTNITTSSRVAFRERVILGTVTSVPCCIFLFINVTMLFTLRSKAVFRDSSRYILLFNLLLADTIQMTLSQLLYILSVCNEWLMYPVCGLLVMLSVITNEISPLTLVVMSLERYVAVCHPLRHTSIVTSSNTALAIMVVWAISSLNVLVHIVLLLDFPFEDLDTLLMKDFCGTLVMFLGSMSEDYDRAFVSFVFVSAAAVITSTYIGVMVAAKSASTDKASARKARNTLLLHLAQLGLSLLSTIHNSVVGSIARVVTRPVLIIILNTLYVLVIMLPRCLSSLIYGLRDKTIRPLLFYHLCCGLKLKPRVSP